MDHSSSALHTYLRDLERRARSNRTRQNLPYSRRELSKVLRSEFEVDLDARRLSYWLADDSTRRQAPTPVSEPKLWALVQLWSRWAGEPKPARRALNELLEWAQPARDSVRAPAPSLPDFLLPLLTEQVERGEAWPYIVHDGTGARRSLSAVHVQQQLDETQAENEPTTKRRRGRIEEVLEDPASSHLLLESGPGSGKSTLLARLAGHLSAELLDAKPMQTACVPVWTTAEQLATGQGGVDRELSRLVFGGTERSERRFVDATEGLLPEGYFWLLLVDGFDEIPTGSRNRLAHNLTAIARTYANHGGNFKIVVSCRPLASVDRDRFTKAGFLVFTMAPFGRLQLETFAERWFGSDGLGYRQAREFLAQVDAAKLRELVTVPLLAAIAAAVFEAWPEQRLPNNQYALFDQYRTYLTNAKATQREGLFSQMRTLAGRDPWALEAIRFLQDNLGDLLRHVATQTVRNLSEPARRSAESDQQAVFNPMTAALKWLRLKVGPRAQTSIPGWGEYVAALMASSGLLVVSEGSMRFLHASFAEFLASEARAMELPEHFDGSSKEWQTFAFEAARSSGLKGRNHRAVLVHYAHRHPLAAEALLTWLLQGSSGHQHVAGVLMAEGSPYTPAQLRIFLSALPRLPAASWHIARQLSDPQARTYLDEQDPIPFPADTEVDSRSPLTDEPWTIDEHSVVRNLLDTLGCADNPNTSEDTWLFCSLVCNLEFVPVLDRMTLIDMLHATAPKWAEHVIEHMVEILNSLDAHPGDRIQAAETLLDFDGEHLDRAAAVLLEIATDRSNSFDERSAATESLSELGAPYHDQARQLFDAMIQEPAIHAYQRHELLSHVELLTSVDITRKSECRDS